MPFELRDFQDLVRLLREHPGWREELRALLLTHELLTLPVLVRELAEGQERLTETVAQLAEEQRRLTGGQQRFEVQMAEMRGWFLEERSRTHAPAYFGRFLRQVQPVHMGRLADALRERLAEDELAEVLLADLILTGRLPTPAGPLAVWIVLEVSPTRDRLDVEQAQRRAALLRHARYPAVAGVMEATAGARRAAGEIGVALLLDGHIDEWQEAVDHMLEEGEAGSP